MMESSPHVFSGPVLVVAEVSQSHDGSLGAAHAYIDGAADAGAGAIKFQTHIAAAESTRDEPWRVPFSRQDESRYDYWRRMEFTQAQWQGLVDHADEREIGFITSPFSRAAVEMLEPFNIAMWKVASGEVGHSELLAELVATGRPVILSSGLSDLDELDAAVTIMREGGVDHAVLQCTTAYPCPPERIGLNQISVLAARYGCPVGLSDHSATIYPGLAAVALGARVIEVHVTFSRSSFGPDVPASLTFEELAQLTEGVRFLEVVAANPVDRDDVGDRAELRSLFTRSLAVHHDLPAGSVLTEKDLVLKKPGSGMPPAEAGEVVGRRLRVAVSAERLLRPEDLEPR